MGKEIFCEAQALEYELNVIGATLGDFDHPHAALAALIDWHVATAIDPRCNGGFSLQFAGAEEEQPDLFREFGGSE